MYPYSAGCVGRRLSSRCFGFAGPRGPPVCRSVKVFNDAVDTGIDPDFGTAAPYAPLSDKIGTATGRLSKFLHVHCHTCIGPQSALYVGRGLNTLRETCRR